MTTKSWQGNLWLADQSDAMTHDLIELCNINSGSDHLEGLKRAAGWLERFFAPLGIPCQRLDLPTYSILDDKRTRFKLANFYQTISSVDQVSSMPKGGSS